MEYLERRREHLSAEYDRLRSKVGAFESTDLKHIVALSVCHVQLSQTIEALAERKELPDDCDC